MIQETKIIILKMTQKENVNGESQFTFLVKHIEKGLLLRKNVLITLIVLKLNGKRNNYIMYDFVMVAMV